MFGTTRTFSTQPFGRCFDGYYHDNEFYLLDLSDSNQVVKKLIHKSEGEPSEKNPIFESMENIILDWEGHMIHQLTSVKDVNFIMRAYCSTMIKRSEYSRMLNRSSFKLESIDSFDKDHIQNIDRFNEGGIGFVGGSMILSNGGDAFIERGKKKEFTPEHCSELPLHERPQFPVKNTTMLIALPCEDVLNRKYSLNSLYFNGKLYPYDLESGKFNVDHSIGFSSECDVSFAFSGRGFNDNCVIIPYLEGTRLRVFVHQNRCLYELIWNQEGTEIILIKHLDWMTEITSIVRLDNFGLLINSDSECFAYSPQAFNIQHSKDEGELRKLSIKGSINYLYSPISKTIIYNENHEYRKSISIPEIENVKSEKIKDIFNEEEYLEKLKKDLEFSAYVPKLLTDAMCCIDVAGGRIKKAYQVNEDRYDDVEIIAGLKCKNYMDKLGEVISKDYIELEITDFGDYLGAPIMYMDDWSSVLTYRNYITDLKDCKRSSNQVEISSADNGFVCMSTSLDLRTAKFVGILSCKEPIANNTVTTEPTTNEKKEYQVLYESKEFRVEGTSIIANDPIAESNGVIIENTRPGIWKWITTNKPKDYVRGGRIDKYLTAQIIAIHSDYYQQLTSNPKLFNCSTGIYRELEGSAERTDYYQDPVEDGWHVMKLGIGVDAGYAGFFDLKHYNDLEAFGIVTKPKSLLARSLKLSYGSDWSNYLSKQLQKANYASKLAVPYGILTSAGYGDGCYACLFKKSNEGDVIAVRIIFA